MVLTERYVPLIGDPGAGKSLISQKLTGKEGLISTHHECSTQESKYLYVDGGKGLHIADTPGCNSMNEVFVKSIQIAGIIGHRQVSKILIVVKADLSFDVVIRNIQTYTDGFQDVPSHILAILVTHMDKVDWVRDRFVEVCKANVGMGEIIFCGIDTPKELLLQDILSKCGKPYDFCITGDSFFKFFDTCGHQRKYLKYTKEAVDDFKRINRSFHDQLSKFEGNDRIDLHFEFQKFMKAEIDRAKLKMASVLEFTFTGENAYVEAGYVANMTKQLIAVLSDIRMTLNLELRQIAGVVKKCPHCNEVWELAEGLNTLTTCGNRPNSLFDLASGRNGFATFEFETTPGALIISKIGVRDFNMVMVNERNQDRRGLGCGRSINWKSMEIVWLPLESQNIGEISTEDINALLPEASGVCKNVEALIRSMQASL